jgi:hypothetical protein
MILNDFSIWKTTRRPAVWLLSTLVTVALAGCGGSSPLSGVKVYPVKGKITLPDGKPLSSGKAVFVGTKSSVTSAANIESDGSFTFKGGANGDGLPEGEYKVRLEVGERSGAKKSTTPLFPSKYLDEDTSDLTAAVKADEASNSFDFKLTPNSPSKSSSSRGGR